MSTLSDADVIGWAVDTREVNQDCGHEMEIARFEPGLVGGHCIGVDPYYPT